MYMYVCEYEHLEDERLCKYHPLLTSTVTDRRKPRRLSRALQSDAMCVFQLGFEEGTHRVLQLVATNLCLFVLYYYSYYFFRSWFLPNSNNYR